jgi:hypothetical protein
MFSLKRHVWNALQPLLNRALDLAPAERLAWLDELRADCPTLARELELLLRPELDAAVRCSHSHAQYVDPVASPYPSQAWPDRCRA